MQYLNSANLANEWVILRKIMQRRQNDGSQSFKMFIVIGRNQRSRTETSRFWVEYDYEYVIFSMVSSTRAWAGVILARKRGSRRHSTTSLSECRSGENKKSNVRSFIILQSGEALTSFNNDNSANLSGEKKYNEEFRAVYFLIIREKNLNEISYS